MSDTTEQQAQELDDFDVEGHSLKGVAIGLGAASIVAGGAATTLAMDKPMPGTTGGVQTAVAGVHADVKDTSGFALKTAGAVADRTTTTVGSTASTAITAVTPVAQQAVSTVGTTVGVATDLATDVVADPVGATDVIVDDAVADVRDVRDDALDTVEGTADGAVITVGDAVDGAVTTVDDAVDLVDPQVSVTTSGGTGAGITAAGHTVSAHVG